MYRKVLKHVLKINEIIWKKVLTAISNVEHGSDCVIDCWCDNRSYIRDGKSWSNIFQDEGGILKWCCSNQL